MECAGQLVAVVLFFVIVSLLYGFFYAEDSCLQNSFIFGPNKADLNFLQIQLTPADINGFILHICSYTELAATQHAVHKAVTQPLHEQY